VNPAINDPAFRRGGALIQKTIRPNPIPSEAQKSDSHSNESGDDEDGLEFLKIHWQPFIQSKVILNSN